MATRQELYTAIGIIRQTCRMNAHVVIGIPHTLSQPLGSSDGLGSGKETFAERKESIANFSDVVKNKCENIRTVLTKADNHFLDTGMTAIPVVANRLKVDTDEVNISALLPSLKSAVLTTNNMTQLSAIPVSHTPECGTAEPNPWELFPKETNYLNILHDIIDALSYELQGRNSYTGEAQYLPQDQFDKLISNRIFTANIYLSKLYSSSDKEQLRSILEYIESNYKKLPSIEIGKHIDANLPKLIMVRRWWAL